MFTFVDNIIRTRRRLFTNVYVYRQIFPKNDIYRPRFDIFCGVGVEIIARYCVIQGFYACFFRASSIASTERFKIEATCSIRIPASSGAVSLVLVYERVYVLFFTFCNNIYERIKSGCCSQDFIVKYSA